MIIFTPLYMLYWRFIIVVNYRQQIPPSLFFASPLAKVNLVNGSRVLRFLKTKQSLPSPFVVLLNHSVYVVFLDPHQGIDDFAFFLPTSKSLCGSQVGMNIRTYLHCIYCKVKTRIQGEKCHTLRSRCVCVWIYIWWLT